MKRASRAVALDGVFLRVPPVHDLEPDDARAERLEPAGGPLDDPRRVLERRGRGQDEHLVGAGQREQCLVQVPARFLPFAPAEQHQRSGALLRPCHGSGSYVGTGKKTVRWPRMATRR